MRYPAAICLLLIFLLSSCSSTGAVTCEGEFVYNTNSFSLEQQEWIKESATRWNDWVGYSLVHVTPGTSEICSIEVGKTKKDSAIGEANSRTGLIVIDLDDLSKPVAKKEVFEGVVMHEMGHTLGFAHHGENGKALMAPAGSQDFTEIDRIWCIKLDYCQTLSPPNAE